MGLVSRWNRKTVVTALLQEVSASRDGVDHGVSDNETGGIAGIVLYQRESQ